MARSIYVDPSPELRARVAREEAATNARQATAITVTLPTDAVRAMARDAEERARKAAARADDETRDAEYRALWHARANFWGSVVDTIDDALAAERVRR